MVSLTDLKCQLPTVQSCSSFLCSGNQEKEKKAMNLSNEDTGGWVHVGAYLYMSSHFHFYFGAVLKFGVHFCHQFLFF